MGVTVATLSSILAASTATLLVALALLSQHSSPFTRVHASTNTHDENPEPGIVSSFSQFPYDENDHLASHVLAYPAIEPCRSLVESQIQTLDLSLHLPLPVSGDVATALFGDTVHKECPAVCLDRGVDQSLVPYPMPQKYYSPGEGHPVDIASFLGSYSCAKVEIVFINYYPQTLHLYWVDANNVEHFQYEIKRGEKNARFIHTFLTHRFRAKDPDTNQVVFDEVVEFATVFGMGNHVNPHRDRDIRKEVRRVMDGEWNKKQMVTRTFSALGFDKGRLPKDLFGSMRSFYYNNRESPHRLLEEWDSKGVYVNYWETDCNFIMIPWTLKKWWQMRLLDVVQEWAGVEIEQTDLYGMRQYTRGARLLTHVDRINTHAVSLIVNIAQGNVTKPWTVEVYDHADRLHEVVMEPGDIIYYESAKSLHGRNTPLAGGFYTNLFTHYRPIGDPEWYRKENPPGTPEPLMDVGKCELVGKKNEYSVGAVKCENDAIGPHLSPKLLTARSGEDLYNLWLNVGPAFDDELVPDTEPLHKEHFDEEEIDEYYEEEYYYEDEEDDGDEEGGHDEF